MRIDTSAALPARNVFFSKLVETVFPDIEENGYNRNGYGYSRMCAVGAEETGLTGGKGFARSQQVISGLEKMSSRYKAVNASLGLKPVTGAEDGVIVFTSSDNHTLTNYLKPGRGATVRLPFETAVFFSWLLLKRKGLEKERREFVSWLLETAGMHDIQPLLLDDMCRFNWSELGNEGTTGDKAFELLAYLLLSIMADLGTEKTVYVEKARKAVHRLYQEELDALAAMLRTQIRLLESNQQFEPRSIQTSRSDLKLQDVYVDPVFSRENGEAGTPFSGIWTSPSGCRRMIVAKTGMGKSAYLQMQTLKELQWLNNDGPKQIEKFVISIPARMFSYCSRIREGIYRKWTGNFTTLFFNCMIRFSENINFYSPQTLMGDMSDSSGNPVFFHETKSLRRYLGILAQRGKLLLILDSFDELPQGEIRTGYLRAMAKFSDDYCLCPVAGEVGAHVITASREMSERTMGEIRHSLSIRPEDVYRIEPMGTEQQKMLIERWSAFRHTSEEEIRAIYSEMENNHFYRDYSSNPYMLSVICFYFGKQLHEITRGFIGQLLDRTKNSASGTNEIIEDVLSSLESILEETAGITILRKDKKITSSQLDTLIARRIDSTELSKEDLEEYIRRLHEIFVMGVGLIVPADGRDRDYQFINDRILYELAARGFKKELSTREPRELDEFYRDKLLPSQESADAYTGMLVPLICSYGLENVQLTSQMIVDLTMWDYRNAGDDEKLLEAMVDLLLGRYSDNLCTAEDPGYWEKSYVRKAQRALLMRLCTAEHLKLTDGEKEALKNSAAFGAAGAWIRQDLLDALTGGCQ